LANNPSVQFYWEYKKLKNDCSFWRSSPETEDDEGFLTKISVKVPSVGGEVNIGGVCTKPIKGIITK